jgi:hypothetical protein
MMGLNHTFQRFAETMMNNGEKTLSWEDVWVNNSPMSMQFMWLYMVSLTKLSTEKSDVRRVGVLQAYRHYRAINMGKSRKFGG